MENIVVLAIVLLVVIVVIMSMGSWSIGRQSPYYCEQDADCQPSNLQLRDNGTFGPCRGPLEFCANPKNMGILKGDCSGIMTAWVKTTTTVCSCVSYGCKTTFKPIENGHGIDVTAFSFDSSTVQPSRSTVLTLSVQNAGESDATNVMAYLSGLPLGTMTDAWQVANTVSQCPAQMCNVPGTGTISATQPSINLAGGSYDFSWTLTSPSVSADITYTANARVFYKYVTHAAAALRVVSNDYLKSLSTQQAATLQGEARVISQSSTNAPIGVSFSTGSRPLVITSTASPYIFQIILTNVGGSEPFDAEASYSSGTIPASSSRLVGVKVVTDLPGAGCMIGTSGTLDLSGQITLAKSESKSIYCQFAGPNNLVNVRDYTVTVDLAYGYYRDASTTINVKSAPTG